MILLKSSTLSRSKIDTTLGCVLTGAAILASLLILVVFAFLISESKALIESNLIGHFFFDRSWNPTIEQFNILPMIVGSILVALGATFLAIPIALALATVITLRDKGKFASILKNSVEVSAALPSVILGFWGLTTVVPLINRISPPGASLLAGCLILTLMIVPTITIAIITSIKDVYKTHVKQIKALVISDYTFFKSVIIPHCRVPIVTGVILGTARAIGETMVVVMVTGNIVQIPDSVLAPIRTLTANIALEVAYATDLHRSALFFTGFVLCCIATFAVLLIHKMQRSGTHV